MWQAPISQQTKYPFAASFHARCSIGVSGFHRFHRPTTRKALQHMEEKDPLPTCPLATWRPTNGTARGKFDNCIAGIHDPTHSCVQFETSSRSRGILHGGVVAEGAVLRLVWIGRIPPSASFLHVLASLLVSVVFIRLVHPPTPSSGRIRRASAPRHSSITSLVFVDRSLVSLLVLSWSDPRPIDSI